MKLRFATSFLAVMLGAALAAFADDDDLAAELPRIPPMDPEQALQSFVAIPGFKVDQVAAEPLVKSPVSVCYDADGALYVVEMRGYPFTEDKPSGAVVRLEDRDGDGRFETQNVFVDGLMWPTGIVPYDGGVFIAVAPDIIYAKDTDGDGKADIREVVFSGFSTANVQGLINNLTWGTDGWIHGSASSNGGVIKNVAHPDRPDLSVRGRNFRFKPDTLELEATSGGGQHGYGLDDWGHWFACNNSNHMRQIVLPSHDLERNPAYVPPAVILDIAVDGAAAPVFRISPAEPWRVVRTRQRAADPEMRKRLPETELHAIGYFTSATGVRIYRGSAYPEEFQGNAFVGDVGGNLVHRKTLKVNGAVFSADRADEGVEFLASPDNWFRPVDFVNTPNGTLLIIDMYRETIEHPVSIPEPIKKHLDLTSGKDRGRLYEVLRTDAPRPLRRPKLANAPTAELVQHLADPDSWWRETAQRLLIERKATDAAPALHEMAAKRPTALGRIHALWTLDALGLLENEDLAPALSDPEPRLREAAARLVEGRLKTDRALLPQTITLADDPDSMVRFQVALTLGEANDDPRALEALASIAARDGGDRWTRAAVLSSIAGRAADLLEILAERDGFLGGSTGRVWLDELAGLVGSAKDPKQVEGLIDNLFAKELADDAKAGVILALGRGLKRAGGSLKATLSESAWRQLDPLFDNAAETADSAAPESRRVAAIALVGLSGPERSLEALPVLLDARQPSGVQLAALRALAEQTGPAVADRIVGQWRSMSPASRREAAEVLFSRTEWIGSLLSAVEAKELGSSEIDPPRLKQLREHDNASIRDRAAKLFGTSADASAGLAETLKTYQAALELQGDREKGKLVHQQHCATCHQAEGVGVAVGPDLATVATRSPDDLLVHILDPNREVASNYLNYNVATVDGRVVSGIIASESASALVLKRAEGVSEVVPRDQIEEISSTGISLMPEGLEKEMTVDQTADLIAFIRSIQSASAPASQ